MKTKVQAKFIDEGFGFPVHLLNVPMVNIRGNWTPKINYAELTTLVLKALAQKPARLTGNEQRFIRQSLGLTLKEFATTFYVTHPAVLKWEKTADKPTKMAWATEKDIRLFIMTHTDAEDLLPAVYKMLRSRAPEVKRNTRINVREFKPELCVA